LHILADLEVVAYQTIPHSSMVLCELTLPFNRECRQLQDEENAWACRLKIALDAALKLSQDESDFVYILPSDDLCEAGLGSEDKNFVVVAGKTGTQMQICNAEEMAFPIFEKGEYKLHFQSDSKISFFAAY